MGYWPSLSGEDGFKLTKFFFFLFACLWTETESRFINSQKKKRTSSSSSHLDRNSLVNKGFVIWLSGKFFSRDTAGSPEGDFDIFMEAKLKFPTPGQLGNVKFPLLGDFVLLATCLSSQIPDSGAALNCQNPDPGESWLSQFPLGSPPPPFPPWG